MNDDNDILGEIFEGKVEILNTERGQSFGLDEMTYFRLAKTCMNANAMGIEPSTIAKLPGEGERGCRVWLFGKRHLFELVVRVRKSETVIHVSCQPLSEKLHCIIPLYEGCDCDAHWSHALRSMAAVEDIAYYDQYWAAEQQSRQEED
jgi:hypothetical protein